MLEKGSAQACMQITCEEGGTQKGGDLQALSLVVRGEEWEGLGCSEVVFEEMDGGRGMQEERNLQPLAPAVRGEEGEGSDVTFEASQALCVG